ncbi:hypothetical protein RCL1_001304 [Eukaryota sp. TZLM3-RCL]
MLPSFLRGCTSCCSFHEYYQHAPAFYSSRNGRISSDRIHTEAVTSLKSLVPVSFNLTSEPITSIPVLPGSNSFTILPSLLTELLFTPSPLFLELLYQIISMTVVPKAFGGIASNVSIMDIRNNIVASSLHSKIDSILGNATSVAAVKKIMQRISYYTLPNLSCFDSISNLILENNNCKLLIIHGIELVTAGCSNKDIELFFKEVMRLSLLLNFCVIVTLPFTSKFTQIPANICYEIVSSTNNICVNLVKSSISQLTSFKLIVKEGLLRFDCSCEYNEVEKDNDLDSLTLSLDPYLYNFHI